MLKKLKLNNFVGVPYLASSALMTRHKGALKFSTDKPNVLVGPNGSGKSALLNALAIRFLAYYTGRSSLDGNFLKDRHAGQHFWSKAERWSRNWNFMEGLELNTDNAPTVYYRPGHIPGNEADVTHAMMMGYFDTAKAYARLVEEKSSGQQCLALLQRFVDTLEGRDLPSKYGVINWGYGTEPKELDRAHWVGDYEEQAEVLKLLVKQVGAQPLVLMDEPEQSLDALAEIKLWHAIEHADCSTMQVIVASHSLYPLLHRDKFNIIEAETGFVRAVLKGLNS